MRSPSNKLGKYEIRELLGKGSMGMVFLARDPILERDVAIKVMSGSSIPDEKMKERFEREAKAVARLHHPNIVTIHDLGYQRGSPFIAMERLEGTDLEELVEKDPPSLGRKLEIIIEVCRGLEHAHSHGVVHRDIKPANIFVTRDGTVKITDFGVARWTQSTQTQAGVVVGTAGYMSPEQLRGKAADGRSDIFGLGIVLFEVLTNRVLFSGDTLETIFFKTLSRDTPVVATADGTRLPELQNIINRALAKDPEQRYSSAGEMAEAIQAFMRTHESVLGETASFQVLEVDSGEGPVPIAGSRKAASHGERPEATGSGDRTPGLSKRTTVAPARRVAVTPQGPRVSTERRHPGAGIGRSSQANRLPVVGAVTIIFVGSIGVYLSVFHRPASSWREPATGSPEISRPTDMDLERRFTTVEKLLEDGQIDRALEEVDSILARAPGNPRALELKVAIGKSAENRGTLRPVQPSRQGERESGPQSPSEPTPREQAALLAADAALALSHGKLEDARSLVARGEHLDPRNPHWASLRDQLRAREAEVQWKSDAAKYVQEGKQWLEAGEFQKAIDAYKKAMEYDLANLEARAGLEEAINLKQQAERAGLVPARRYVESETEFIPDTSDSGELLGFEKEERLKVKETMDPFSPAQIIIEFNPTDAKSGEPYVLRVRVFNKGYDAVEVQSLELVSWFGGKTTGRGNQIPVRIRRVAPQSTAVLHEISGTWEEALNQGEIEATVTLVGGGKLRKSIRW